jgi:hypothetical protein
VALPVMGARAVVGRSTTTEVLAAAAGAGSVVAGALAAAHGAVIGDQIHSGGACCVVSRTGTRRPIRGLPDVLHIVPDAW